MLQTQGTAVVNGQLIGAIPGVSQYVPGFAPYSAVSPAGPLTIPPSISTPGGGGTLTGTADSNAQAAAAAEAEPFNIRKSPVIPALVGLAIALWALHAIHFREEISAREEA